MSEYTPDTLYKWALETGGDIGPVIAHADAWEADQLLLAQWHNEARLRKEEILRLRKRLEAAEIENRHRVVFKHIDATPDDEYPLRILRAYREDCNLTWATTTDGTPSDSRLVEAMNDMQRERAAILDRAIAALAAGESA